MPEIELPNTMLTTSVESSSELSLSTEDNQNAIAEEKEPIDSTRTELVANPSLSLDEIQETISQINQTLSYLKSDFQTKIKYDENKEKIITSLHDELQKHREDLHFKILRSFALDVLSLYDEMKTTSSQTPDSLNVFASVLQDTEDVLARYGFEIYEQESETYDRSLQKVQKTEATEQPELNGCVAQRLRKGLRYESRIVRPEIVNVYRYVAPKAEKEDNLSDLSQ